MHHHYLLPGAPVEVVQALGMSSLSLSLALFYMLAAYGQNRTMMAAALPLRALAVIVFAENGAPWSQVAVFEAVMDALILGAVLWDRGKNA